MTRVELPSVDVSRADSPEPDGRAGRVARRGLGWWIGAVALGVLAAWVTMTIVVAWTRWGRFDPNLGSEARESIGTQLSPAEHPWYFPILTLHVMGALVALGTCVFQIWPWLRRRHPRAHRYIGRVYVFAGVYPSCVAALVVEAFWPFSVLTRIGQVVMALLWGFTTTVGFVLRRQGRIADHRRWMLRSFGFTCAALAELAIQPIVPLLLAPEANTRFRGDPAILVPVTTAVQNWAAMVIVLLAVEGYLERERLRRTARRHRSSATAQP